MPTPTITVKLDGATVPCRPKLEDDITRCDLRTLAEALGYVVGTEDWPTITLTRRP